MSLSGKKLLMLGAGVFQVPAIRKAQEMGLEVIAISNLPNDPGMKIANKSFQISTLEKDAVLEIARTEKINGVLTVASEAAAPTASCVAEKLNLPGYTYRAALTIANKLHLRQMLHREGLSKIRFGDASTPELAAASMARLPRPLILKPLFSSGSRGVKKIETPAELALHLPNSVAHSLLFKGALLEEFVDGIPVSGELIISNGKIVAAAFSRKYYNRHFVTSAHLMPLQLPERRQAFLLDLCERIIYALGLENGALDLDLAVTETEIEIIELGGRLGGNSMAELACFHTGFDFTEAAIRIAMGEKIEPHRCDNKPVAVHIISSEKAGKLKKMHQFAEMFPEECGNLLSQSAFFEPGSPVMAYTQGNFQLGNILFTAASPGELQILLQKVQSVEWAIVE